MFSARVEMIPSFPKQELQVIRDVSTRRLSSLGKVLGWSDLPPRNIYTPDRVWHAETLKYGYGMCHTIPRVQDYTGRSA